MALVGNIKGAKGDTGAVGPQGVAGTPGSVFHFGQGVPADSLGVDTDVYLDQVSFNLYVKVGGTWA